MLSVKVLYNYLQVYFLGKNTLSPFKMAYK